MSGGPQSLRSSPPANVLAQDRKLHQLGVPERSSAHLSAANSGDLLAGSGIGSSGPSSSSWDDREVARQIALLTEERDFLRKYVSRCEHELKAYQLQHPDLVGGHTAAGSNGDLLNELSGSVEELPPWIGQAKYMSPLLVAYEARIEELMEKNQAQLHDFSALKQQYDDLYKRNSEAEAELESNIKNLLQHMDQQKGGAAGGHKPAADLDEDEVSELQEQVQLYKEQLDIVQSQKLELEQELGKTRHQVQEVRGERDQFWQGEVKKHQNLLAQLRMERDRFKNSSSNLGQSQLDLASLQKEHLNLQKKFLATQVSLETTEQELDQAIDKEKAATANLVNAERDLESLLKTLQGMERDADDARARDVQQVKKEGELLSRAEAARLEKDQALLRETALRADVSRLEDRLAFELAGAHRKHDEDIAEVWTRAKEVETSLNNELANMGLVLTEAEVAKEKAMREAQHARATAEKVFTSVQGEITSLKGELGLAHTRQAELTHAQETQLTKLKRAEAELQRATDFYAKEKIQSLESVNALKLKNESLTTANQNASVQLGRLSDSMQRLEKEHADLRRTSEQTIARLQGQLLELEAQRKSQVDELKLRLDEAYRMHERSEARAAELLQAQDLLSEKWRDENKQVRGHLSKLLTEEKNATAGLHARVAEFEARVQQLVRERDQAMVFQSQYEQLKASQELVVGDLQHRVAVLTSELSSYAGREPEYLLAQKTLQGKLDRAEIEVKRLTRQYEAARKKADFLENQSAGMASVSGGAVQPLQLSHAIMNQAVTGQASAPTRTGQVTSGIASYLQPIPVAQSLLPPTFAKKV